MLSHIERAGNSGARCVLGGGVPQSATLKNGWFVEVNNDMPLARDEVFGPVLAVIPFDGMKRSGIGRESGQVAIDEYLNTKTVWIDMGAPGSNPFVMR